MSGSARQRNMQSMEKIDTTELSGGVMPRDLFDEFYQRVQEESELLGMVRTVELPRKEMSIPSLGVGSREMIELSEDTAPGSFSSADSGDIKMETSKTGIPFELTTEAVEDTVDDVADIILQKFQTQFAVDSQDLAINGDTTSGDSFESIMDGWLYIAENGDGDSDRLDSATMPAHDALGDPLNTTLVNDAIQTMEEKYRDSDRQVILTSDSQVQEYMHDLTNREDGIGTAVLRADAEISPFSYDLVGVSNWPDDQLMLTDPNNLIYGLYRDVEIDVVDNSDETLERDLFARYMLRARWDVNIEDLDAGVRVHGVATP